MVYNQGARGPGNQYWVRMLTGYRKVEDLKARLPIPATPGYRYQPTSLPIDTVPPLTRYHHTPPPGSSNIVYNYDKYQEEYKGRDV